MIAQNTQPDTSESIHFSNSKKIYIDGTQPGVRVPFREISLSPTRLPSGAMENNEAVRVYDTSGPWGDEAFEGDVHQGLPALRRDWIISRGDVEEYDGRAIRSVDNGYLSEDHARWARDKDGKNGRLEEFTTTRRPLRAKTGKVVTQLAYARAGIITPEMEFVAIRENARLQSPDGALTMSPDVARNDLRQQHPGNPWGAAIPREITPEFVRD